MVIWGPCGVGGRAVRCIVSGAMVERPWIIPCIHMFDC